MYDILKSSLINIIKLIRTSNIKLSYANREPNLENALVKIIIGKFMARLTLSFQKVKLRIIYLY
ncbi:hypothetical protein LM800396_230015 [Listeria monocytogenes]|nr:hypothetical protein LM800396_230015 [Listeria monocytogenes]